jgi:hypothetical protein
MGEFKVGRGASKVVALFFLDKLTSGLKIFNL